jgi:hypothetical protein
MPQKARRVAPRPAQSLARWWAGRLAQRSALAWVAPLAPLPVTQMTVAVSE